MACSARPPGLLGSLPWGKRSSEEVLGSLPWGLRSSEEEQTFAGKGVTHVLLTLRADYYPSGFEFHFIS